jgi:hypothetical protein
LSGAQRSQPSGSETSPGAPPDHDDRRSRLLREGGSLRPRRDEHEGAGRRIHPLAVDLEDGMSLVYEVQLLVAVVRLVVLVDDQISLRPPRPRGDAEGRDAEVVPDRRYGLRPSSSSSISSRCAIAYGVTESSVRSRVGRLHEVGGRRHEVGTTSRQSRHEVGTHS